MKNKLFVVVVNLMLFWVFADIMVGISSKNDRPIGFLVAGLLYGIIIASLAGILGFFKFPDNFWGRFLIGTMLTLALLLLINSFFKGILEFSAGHIGGIDMILFTIPKLLVLPNKLAVIFFSSVILNLCSIILDKLGDK